MNEPRENAMKILVLHRVPYPRIEYHRGIDHSLHDVTYFGKRQIMETLPAGLRCTAVERAGDTSPFTEAQAWLSAHPQRFDRIISMSEYELLDAAQLREWLGVPGASVRQVMLSRDKVEMKARVAAAGLQVPRFLTVPEFMAAGGQAPWSGRTVLKPHCGASSVDVVIFASPRAAHEAILSRNTGASSLDSGQQAALAGFEVEEFVDGPIRHFDGLVADGRLLAATASEYVGTCLEYANGRPLASFQTHLSAEAWTWIELVLKAVEIRDGSFHLEAIIDPAGLVFLEVGNRVGGADVVPTFELATNLHLPSLELRVHLGQPVAGHLAAPPREPWWHGWFVFPGHQHAGRTFEGFDGDEELRHSPSILNWHDLPRGKTLPSHVTYSAHETALAGMVRTASPSETQELLRKILTSLRLRTSSPPVLRSAPRLSASNAA